MTVPAMSWQGIRGLGRVYMDHVSSKGVSATAWTRMRRLLALGMGAG